MLFVRRDAGKFFCITEASRVCSIQQAFQRAFGGRFSLNTSAVPSIFACKKKSLLESAALYRKVISTTTAEVQVNEFACLPSDV